jgi:hypothetical protein
MEKERNAGLGITASQQTNHFPVTYVKERASCYVGGWCVRTDSVVAGLLVGATCNEFVIYFKRSFT